VLAQADSTSIDQFFTLSTLGTLAGSSAAALLIGNVASFLVPANQQAKRTVGKWAAFVGALAVSFFLFVYGAADPDGSEWFVAFFNGILIFATAYGLNESAAADGSWTAP
jgi:hypothetical protein